MAEIKIIRSNNVWGAPLPGVKDPEAGWIKRVVYTPHVFTGGSFLGVAECKPGYSIHRWHTHTKDQADGYEVIYPPNFEEIYYIVSGRGVIQWKTEGGNINEEELGPGDALFMPAGVAEHQLFNNGKEKIIVIFCGYPTPKVTLTP